MVKSRAKLRDEAGAAAVEFAMVAGLLFMLVFGLIEYGFAFFEMQTLRGATREGARVAAVGGTSGDIQTRMVNSSAGALSSPVNFTVTPGDGCDPAAPNSADESVTVRLTPPYPSNVQQAFQIDVPFLPPITVDPTIEGSFRCES
jgi:Flp pilus assembly protein TadG